MSASALSGAINHIVGWFTTKEIRYCLVGGLAVSFRTIERATKDIDFAISVASDLEAENLIRALQQIGFAPVELLQHRDSGAISTVRLLSSQFQGIYLDFLFAASGIEHEVVQSATTIELLPGLYVPAATIPSLIAMKVLSSGHKGRRQDMLDLEHLIHDATKTELETAQHLVSLITARGMNVGRDLNQVLTQLVNELREEDD
jgi:predicted nucleotidyltransferase